MTLYPKLRLIMLWNSCLQVYGRHLWAEEEAPWHQPWDLSGRVGKRQGGQMKNNKTYWPCLVLSKVDSSVITCFTISVFQCTLEFSIVSPRWSGDWTRVLGGPQLVGFLLGRVRLLQVRNHHRQQHHLYHLDDMYIPPRMAMYKHNLAIEQDCVWATPRL